MIICELLPRISIYVVDEGRNNIAGKIYFVAFLIYCRPSSGLHLCTLTARLS